MYRLISGSRYDMMARENIQPKEISGAEWKRSGAGRKSGERERSGERRSPKTMERERSVERGIAEWGRSGERGL